MIFNFSEREIKVKLIMMQSLKLNPQHYQISNRRYLDGDWAYENRAFYYKMKNVLTTNNRKIFLITIQTLLLECEKVPRRHRVEFIRNLFVYVYANKWFLQKEPRFAYCVKEKLLDLHHDIPNLANLYHSLFFGSFISMARM